MSGWPVKPLGELLTAIETGSRPKGGAVSLHDGIPSVGGEHIDREGGLNWNAPKYVSRDFFAGMKRGHIQRGDILIVKDGATTGKTMTVRDDFPMLDAAINEHVFLLRTNRSIALPEFVGYFLKGLEGQQQILSSFRGSAIGGIPQGFIRHVHVPIAPLKTQIRIIGLLDEAAGLRKLRAQADRRTADLIPALFHEMFGDPAALRGKWREVKLKDFGRIVTGNTPSRKNPALFGNAIEWIKTDNINAERGLVERATEGLSETGAAVGRVVRAGSVLVTCIAGTLSRLGDASVVDRSVAINQQINAIIPYEQNDATFVSEMVRALKRPIQRHATGVMTHMISKTTLEMVPAFQPPSGLQKEFARRALKIREIESEQRSSKRRLDELFQSTLYHAFRGEL